MDRFLQVETLCTESLLVVAALGAERLSRPEDGATPGPADPGKGSGAG
jgi:hypothetical protein